MGFVVQMIPALFLIILQVDCVQATGNNTTISATSSSEYSIEATVSSSLSTSHIEKSTGIANTAAYPSSAVSATASSPFQSVSNTLSSTMVTAALSASFGSQSAMNSVASTLSVTTSATVVALPSSLTQTSIPLATSSLFAVTTNGHVRPSTSAQTSSPMSMATSNAAPNSTGLTRSPVSTQTSNPSSASISSIEPYSSGSSQPPSSLYSTAGVPTIPPTTPPGVKKFFFSFKIINKVCTIDIRENNAESNDYKSIANAVVAAVNTAYENDPYYLGSRVYQFDCGSVIPFVEVSKNGSATGNSATELKEAKDMVQNNASSGLNIDTSSFSSSPTTVTPKLYIKLDTELSNSQFCRHKSTFKNKFAAILVSTDGQSFVSPGQIVVFGSNCNDQSASYSAAKISFYVTGSTSKVLDPDPELTNRAYKLIKQFVEDGTTWRLSASFHDKVKSVELAGKDKVEETAYSELTIVLIGMGTTFGLLLAIILIILAVFYLRRNKNSEGTPLTIRNQASGIDNTQYESQDETAINIGGHDYEYPEAAPREEKKVQPAQATYQELKPASKEDPMPTVSLYQPLSADEEQKTSVIVEPEESVGYTVSVLSSKPEAKDLTADELARRKDLENQLKLEFESLEYDMPSSNIYASSLMAKNRLSTVIPKPETRVLLNTEYDNPDSDYINASYVMDFHDDKKYIITQGPLQKTTDDFWRMIDEQNINVIVMLTPLVQEGMEKCYQYWPPDSVPRQYGDIKVHLSKKELKPDFTVTTMEMNKNEHQREVVLFRYMSWPENDVPENPKSFVNFLLEAKKANQDRGDSTYVVLCSNGVGMSAVFAAVANGIESFDTKKAADIYSIVKGLRKDRAGAIQHFEQYKFVYQALYEYSLIYQENHDPFTNKSNITSTF